MKRKLMIAGAAVVVLLVVVVVALFLFSEGILRKGIEVAGTGALGVETKLQKVDLSLLGGSFAMNGLSIGNPKGFSSPSLFSLGKGGCEGKVVLADGERDRCGRDRIGLAGNHTGTKGIGHQSDNPSQKPEERETC